MAIDAAGPSGPAAPSPPPEPGVSSQYPVNVEFTVAERNQRFWAIPVIGFIAKLIVLIPHFVVLWILGYAVGLAQMILWIGVLFTGRLPLWGYALVGGYLRWNNRLAAFSGGLTDEYPPFTFRSVRDDGRPFMVQTRFEIPERNSRWWAIPLFGLAIKLILLIPHLVALSIMAIVCAVLAIFVTWAPVLFTGRYPAWGYRIIGGTMRWSTRVMAYYYGLTDRYPPFSLA